MKQKIKKLNLSKRTISNLRTPEMNNIIGGGLSKKCATHWCDSVHKCTLSCSSTVEAGGL